MVLEGLVQFIASYQLLFVLVEDTVNWALDFFPALSSDIQAAIVTMNFNSPLFWTTIISETHEPRELCFLTKKQEMITHNQTSYAKMFWTGSISSH